MNIINELNKFWSGKITFICPLSPAETLIFFNENVVPNGWELISSTISGCDLTLNPFLLIYQFYLQSGEITSC